MNLNLKRRRTEAKHLHKMYINDILPTLVHSPIIFVTKEKHLLNVLNVTAEIENKIFLSLQRVVC